MQRSWAEDPSGWLEGSELKSEAGEKDIQGSGEVVSWALWRVLRKGGLRSGFKGVSAVGGRQAWWELLKISINPGIWHVVPK